MIIGVSHISINSTDLDSDIKNYQANGYELVFRDNNIRNPVEKSLFLKDYKPTHSIALLKKSGVNNIELIEHHKTNIGNNDLYKMPLSAEFSAYSSSVAFWTNGLGFSLSGDELIKTMPIPQMSARIKIAESDPKTCFLDYAGITCIAMFSTDINGDLAILRNNYAKEISEKITLVVNGRALEVMMVRGPSGEMVELVKFS